MAARRKSGWSKLAGQATGANPTTAVLVHATSTSNSKHTSGLVAPPPMISLMCFLTMGSELGIRTTSLRVAAIPTPDLCCFSICCCSRCCGWWPVVAAAAAALAAVDGTKACDTGAAAASRLRPVSHTDGHILHKIGAGFTAGPRRPDQIAPGLQSD